MKNIMLRLKPEEYETILKLKNGYHFKTTTKTIMHCINNHEKLTNTVKILENEFFHLEKIRKERKEYVDNFINSLNKLMKIKEDDR